MRNADATETSQQDEGSTREEFKISPQEEVSQTIQQFQDDIKALFDHAESVYASTIVLDDVAKIRTQRDNLAKKYREFFDNIHVPAKQKCTTFYTKCLLSTQQQKEIQKAITKHCIEYSRYIDNLDDRIETLVRQKTSCFFKFFCRGNSSFPKNDPEPKVSSKKSLFGNSSKLC